VSTPIRIAVVASKTPEAQSGLADLQRSFGALKPDEAEVIVALGGDGFMLQTLHRHRASASRCTA
jgi:NAD+ kinase